MRPTNAARRVGGATGTYVYASCYSVYMPSVSARLPAEEKDELDDVAALLQEDRSTTIRKALREGLHALRVRHAVARYQTGEVATAEAARLADVSVAEWVELAAERNLTLQLTAADLASDADDAQEL